MGFRDRLAEWSAERAGLATTDKERLHLLEESDFERRALARELDLLAYTALDYVSGNPQELKAVERRKLAQKSRIVWMRDPLAGAAIDLMNDFTFGRGLPKPKANDRLVQEVIDEAWDDPDNQEILTTLEAQVRLGTDLSLQANLFFKVFDDGDDGKVKLSLLKNDLVETVVRDPEVPQRILWYVTNEEPYQDWDYRNDQPIVNLQTRGVVLPKVYYPHWRNVDLMREEVDAGARQMPNMPPPEKVGDGKIFQVAINRTSDMALGHPPMDRLLRWFNAYNRFMDARVDMTEAAAAFVMKRKVQGTPTQLQKLATQALSRRSTLGMARDPELFGEPGPKPASILTENQSVDHEPFKLDSGAANAAQDAQMLRANVSAGTRFPQCHDEQTETLTERGWMTLAQIKAAREDLPRIAAYDTTTNRIVYEHPLRFTVGDYAGPMIRFANPQRFDMLVTPNHRMLVTDSNSDHWRFVAAGAMRRAGLYSRVAALADVGHHVDGVTIPAPGVLAGLVRNEAVTLREQGKTHREIELELGRSEGYVANALAGESSWMDAHAPGEVTLDGDAFMRWIGWYVAEGGWGGITQAVDSAHLAEVQEACRNLGIPGREWISERSRSPLWRWEPAQGYKKALRAWLAVNAGTDSTSKRIPSVVFDADERQRMLVLRGVLDGDAHTGPGFWRGEGLAQFYTISRQLADDVQRLAVMCGMRATIKRAAMYESAKGTRQGWWVFICRGKSRSHRRDATWGQMPAPKVVEYDGEVYCFTVPSGAFVTRRNGRVAIHGNSYFGDASDSNLATATCHDAETQTLTSEGWMGLEELKARDAQGTLPLIAAFDTDRECIVYEKPKGGLIVQRYDGVMINLRGVGVRGRVDVMVTPNHRLLLRRGDAGRYGPWETRLAGEVTAAMRYKQRVAAPLTGGAHLDEFVLSAVAVAGKRAGARRGDYAPTAQRNAQIRDLAATYPQPKAGECACGCGKATSLASRNRYVDGKRVQTKGDPAARVPGHVHFGGRDRRIAEIVGCSQRTVHDVLGDRDVQRKARAKRGFVMRPEQRIPMDAFLRWLGWYIAEGADATVYQSEDSPWLAEVQAACRALGVPGYEGRKASRSGVTWYWRPANPAQWTAWLDTHVGVGAANKRVPEFVFALPREQQMEVLRGLMGGDGSCGTGNGWEQAASSMYATTSKGLADDVQRLALHCGFRASLRSHASYMTKRGERTPYYVNLVASDTRRTVRDYQGIHRIERRSYHGEVYCFTMPSDTFITRRNGNVAFHKNSLELPVLKAVEARQEKFESAVRFFVDRVIERAVDVGTIPSDLTDDEREELEREQTQDLPGSESDTWDQPSLGLAAAHEDKGVDERSTERDLGYEFSMPSPLKRMMTDLVSAVTMVAQTFDPNNTNTEMSRVLLGIVLGEGLELEDPQGAVDKIFPPGYVDPAVAAAQAPPPPGADSGDFGATGADGDMHTEDNPYGAPMVASSPDQMGVTEARTLGRAGGQIVWLRESRHRLSDDARQRLAARTREVAEGFDRAAEAVIGGEAEKK